MASYYNSHHDLERIALGVPVQAVIKIKPITSYVREDIKIHQDRIGLLDINNRIREEYGCSDMFDSNTSLRTVFDEVFPPYIRAVMEGVNVACVNFGTTGSGKSYNIEGESTNPGLASLFAFALFDQLDEKRGRMNAARSQGIGFSYSVKMRYVEILDEDINDLFVQANSRAQGELYVIPDEWEGPMISNATWMPVSSPNQFHDMFATARTHRTQAANEFGPLRDKAGTILTIEVLQVTENPSNGDTSILASRVYFIDTPGAEKLNEDPETLRIKEGSTLNKGILALGELIKNLSSNKGEFVSYDDSTLTSLMKDILGGNCLTMAYICLQNGDMVGNSLVLNYMRQLRGIINYPVVNDSRQIGLLRKYRVEIIHLLSQISLLGAGEVDKFNNQISDLEKQLINGNLDKLKLAEERSSIIERLRDTKEAYNKLVKEKADLQDELIRSEEERLQVAKALIELQIENATLQENTSDKTYDINNRLLYAENEILAANMKEEKALQAINEMQDKLKEALEEKREIEIEFVALKANYIRLSNQLSEEKLKNENLSIEVINLVNANKALSGDADYLSKVKGDSSKSQEKLLLDIDRLTSRNRDLEEALINSRSEIEKLKSEALKYEINAQRLQVEYENKKNELERVYIEIAHRRDKETTNKISAAEIELKRARDKVELGDSDVTSLHRQLKAANRKIAELEDNLSEYQKHDSEMTSEVQRLQIQLEEMRGNLRTKLIQTMNIAGEDVMRTAREELIRTYNAKEVDLTDRLNSEIAKNAHNLKVIRGLRAYGRSLKNLAEDWAPVGKNLPDVLLMPPSILLDETEEKSYQKAQNSEYERLRVKNAALEQEVKALQTQLLSNTENYTKLIMAQRDPELQKRLLQELTFLKGAPISASRPGTGSYDIDVLRKERNQLREENRRLHQELREARNSVGAQGSEKALQDEVLRLNKKLGEYERGVENVGSGTTNVRLLQQKIAYLDEVMRKLERERSELSVRATMAEEQLKNLNEHMNSSIQNYQRKIADLNKTVIYYIDSTAQRLIILSNFNIINLINSIYI